MNKIISITFFVILSIDKTAAQSLNKILQRNEQKTGGRYVLLKQWSFEALYRLEELGSYMADSFYVRYCRDNSLSVEAHIKPDIIYREGISNDTAWEQPSPLNPRKIVQGKPFISLYRAVRWPNYIKTIQQFKKEGNKVQLKNPILENGKKFYVLELQINKDSLTREYFIDAATYLIARHRDHRPLHPGEVEKTIETRYSDYRLVDGVFLAFKTEEWDYKLNKLLTVMELKKILFTSN